MMNITKNIPYRKELSPIKQAEFAVFLKLKRERSRIAEFATNDTIIKSYI